MVPAPGSAEKTAVTATAAIARDGTWGLSWVAAERPPQRLPIRLRRFQCARERSRTEQVTVVRAIRGYEIAVATPTSTGNLRKIFNYFVLERTM